MAMGLWTMGDTTLFKTDLQRGHFRDEKGDALFTIHPH